MADRDVLNMDMAIMAGEGDTERPTPSPRADNAGADGTGPVIPEGGAASTWGNAENTNMLKNYTYTEHGDNYVRIRM